MKEIISFLLFFFVFFGIAIIYIIISSVVFEYITPLLLFGSLILSGVLYILDKNKKQHFKKL